MQNALLGFDVNDAYPLPKCGDAEHPFPPGDLNGDCQVTLPDLALFAAYWLQANCGPQNDYCHRADITENGKVNLPDYALLSGQWPYRMFPAVCGSAEKPWLLNDFNRNCSVNLQDYAVFADEWLKPCDWLNWNCRGADLDFNGMVNIIDLHLFVNIR